MGRGKSLNEKEKGRIEQLSALKWSCKRIATEILRSRHLVASYLKNPQTYGKTTRTGRPKAVGKKTLKKIIRKARNKSITSKKIISDLGLDIASKTVRNYLHDEGALIYSKMQGKPPLTAEHKKNRFKMALKHVTWTDKWQTVVFSDEKKFNLDGPDGYKYYWHSADTAKVTFSKRVQGGGSVMIWIGFSYHGKTPVVFVNETMNSDFYIKVLRKTLVPFGRSVMNENFIFQQDNAPCHRAKNTVEWFEKTGIDVLEWPSRSPDLNPVENLFGILALEVYGSGKQYSSVFELKASIEKAWSLIPISVLHNLIHSMQTRMLAVLKSSGDSINY